jgi:hypothetical protein
MNESGVESKQKLKGRGMSRGTGARESCRGVGIRVHAGNSRCPLPKGFDPEFEPCQTLLDCIEVLGVRRSFFRRPG